LTFCGVSLQMLKRAELAMLLLVFITTSLGDCNNCSISERCIGKMCYPSCENAKRKTACECFGDICFDKKWCNIAEQVCCRTCEDDWNSVITIILVLVGTIILAVAYGELCISKEGEVRVEFEDSKHLVQVRASEMMEVAPIKDTNQDIGSQSVV